MLKFDEEQTVVDTGVAVRTGSGLMVAVTALDVIEGQANEVLPDITTS